MEVYETSLTSDKIIDNTEFVVQVIQFLLDSFNKTNITYYTVDWFEIILNHGIKVLVSYKIEYTHHCDLTIQFKKQTSKGIDITTITISVSTILTNTLKEEIEDFIKEYLEENNK